MTLDHLAELLQQTVQQILFVMLLLQEPLLWATIALQITLDSTNVFQMLGLP